jgi:CRISPR-associated protein Cas2
MQKFNFLICYDIADKKRLSKIAKLLEKTSIRIQKSIFYYPKANINDIKTLSLNLSKLLNEKEDDLRIYQIDIEKSLHLNSAISLKKPNIIK